jgi:hypothetical protein
MKVKTIEQKAIASATPDEAYDVLWMQCSSLGFVLGDDEEALWMES